MQSGIRIQKVLSDNGVMSRRKAEQAIEQGRITINGRPSKIGQKIDPKKDLIAIDGKNVRIDTRQTSRTYIMLNKPRGFITTTTDDRGRRTVMDLLDKKVNTRVYPVGRLDQNSEGLIFLTNDGKFANEIMHPSSMVSKTYRVTIRGSVGEETLIDLSVGVVLDDGYRTAPATVQVIEKYPDRTVLKFTVHEGKNRLIRRMCEAAGIELIRLKRTAIGPIKLGMLAPGKYRDLKPSEVLALKSAIKKGLKKSDSEREKTKKG